MGQRQVRPAETPFSSDATFKQTCDPCFGLDAPARGWCGQCNVYLCALCVQSHTRSHKLATGKLLPLTRPQSESVTNNLTVKQVTPITTLEDKDNTVNDDTPRIDRTIQGCVSVNQYIVAIVNLKLKLFNDSFNCIGQIDCISFKPNSICAHGNHIAVSFNRVKESQDANTDQSGNKNKGSKFKDIKTFKVRPPNCISAVPKLVSVRGFTTMGECFCVSKCPISEREIMIAAGMRLDSHPERDDIKFQVQVLKSNGSVLHTLAYNPLGEPCFEGEFFLSGTMTFGEIVVTDIPERRVRGILIKTGKTLYDFEGGSPQGVTMDQHNNLYVYNNAALYWIPPLRNKIYHMMQNYVNTKNRRVTSMKNYISFNDETRHLYVTDINKTTIEVFRIS